MYRFFAIHFSWLLNQDFSDWTSNTVYLQYSNLVYRPIIRHSVMDLHPSPPVCLTCRLHHAVITTIFFCGLPCLHHSGGKNPAIVYTYFWRWLDDIWCNSGWVWCVSASLTEVDASLSLQWHHLYCLKHFLSNGTARKYNTTQSTQTNKSTGSPCESFSSFFISLI